MAKTCDYTQHKILERFLYDNPEIMPDNTVHKLITLLKLNNDCVGRSVAAYPLSLLAISESRQASAVFTELETMIDSPQVHWRIAAFRTLEMITVGESIKTVRNHPESQASIKARLSELQLFDGGNRSLDAHLNWTASFAAVELGWERLQKKIPSQVSVRSSSIFAQVHSPRNAS